MHISYTCFEESSDHVDYYDTDNNDNCRDLGSGRDVCDSKFNQSAWDA